MPLKLAAETREPSNPCRACRSSLSQSNEALCIVALRNFSSGPEFAPYSHSMLCTYSIFYTSDRNSGAGSAGGLVTMDLSTYLSELVIDYVLFYFAVSPPGPESISSCAFVL